MKKTILSTVLLLSLGAQASTSFEQQVLESVVANASSIQLVDAESNQALPADQQLPALIAKALVQNYTNVDVKKGGVLSATSVSCKNTTPQGIVGASTYVCSLSIGDGEFTSKGIKTLTPNTESAFVIELEVSRVVYPGAKPQIQKTAKAFIAG